MVLTLSIKKGMISRTNKVENNTRLKISAAANSKINPSMREKTAIAKKQTAAIMFPYLKNLMIRQNIEPSTTNIMDRIVNTFTIPSSSPAV